MKKLFLFLNILMMLMAIWHYLSDRPANACYYLLMIVLLHLKAGHDEYDKTSEERSRNDGGDAGPK